MAEFCDLFADTILNQVLYSYNKDRYDFNTKTSINSVNKCSCCRNYIFVFTLTVTRLWNYFYNHIPHIIMYVSNDEE